MILNSELVRESFFRVGGTVSVKDFLGQFGQYGTLIISRYPCRFFEMQFKSDMGRSLLCAEPQLPMNLVIATSHFESESSAFSDVRKHQLKDTFKLIKAVENDTHKSHCIIAGDFNFDLIRGKKEEQIVKEYGFKDILDELFAKDVRTMNARGKFKGWRPDKVVMRDHKQNDGGKCWKITKA